MLDTLKTSSFPGFNRIVRASTLTSTLIRDELIVTQRAK